MRTSRRHGSDGFTLIELLISIVILGVITVPLATALMLSFQDGATKLRLSSSHDRLLSGVYFAPDIASTSAFRTTSSCVLPASASFVLGLTWTDDKGVQKVDYALGAGPAKTLYRLKCTAPSAMSPNGPTTTVAAAHEVSTAVCQPVACTALTASNTTVGLVLAETDGQSIKLQGTRRVTP